MKKISILILVVFLISGCDWIEKSKIEKVISKLYTTPICLKWNDIRQENNATEILVDAGVLVKKKLEIQLVSWGMSLGFNMI